MIGQSFAEVVTPTAFTAGSLEADGWIPASPDMSPILVGLQAVGLIRRTWLSPGIAEVATPTTGSSGKPFPEFRPSAADEPAVPARRGFHSVACDTTAHA